MSYTTVITYEGDGVTSIFPIPFEYDTQSEVVVTQDGAPADYGYLNATTITLASPLESGSVLTIQRVTDLDTPAVVFRNGAGTTGSQLNAMVKQLFRGLQEATNLVTRALGLGNDAKWDAQGRVMTNLGEPLGATDAVTKAYADAIVTSVETAAQQAITAAESLTTDAATVAAAAALAEGYANEDVDVPVEPGKYSAYHWAVKAQAFAGGSTSAATTEFTPAGNIAATNVQAAIEELDAEKSAIGHGHAISAITGLQDALDLKAFADDLTEYALLSGAVFSGKITAKTSDSAGAGLRLPAGSTPTSPEVGDVWFNGTEVYLRRTSSATAQFAFKNVATVISAKYTFSASAASGAFLNLGQGSAPTSPVDGDVWMTSAGMFVRAGGSTQQLASASEVLIESGSVSSATAAIDIELPSGYDGFVLVLSDLTGSTAAVPQMRVSFDNGATFPSAAGSYAWAHGNWGTGGAQVSGGAASATAITIYNSNISTTAASAMNIGTLEINPGAVGYHFGVHIQTSTDDTRSMGAGKALTTGRATHIRLLMASGNITNLRWKLYGRV
jgi:hypothetical protein